MILCLMFDYNLYNLLIKIAVLSWNQDKCLPRNLFKSLVIFIFMCCAIAMIQDQFMLHGAHSTALRIDDNQK